MRTFMLAACMAAGFLPLRAAGGQELSDTASGPQAERRAPAVEKWGGFDLLTSAIQDEAAQGAGTGSRAYGGQLRLGLTAHRVLTLSTDLGIVGMSDEYAFTQETTHGEKTSGVAAGMGSLALGVRTPPLAVDGTGRRTVSTGVNAGYTLLHVTRTITDCTDCHGEDVPLRAGPYWEAVLDVVPGGRWGVSARYRTYGGPSDLRDALVIGGTWKMQRAAERPPVVQVPVDGGA
jgi:hypothetical protein